MYTLRSNKKSEGERILCFGSTRGRFYGLRRVQSFPGPFEYKREDSFLKKLPNKTGYTLLASKNPRYKEKVPEVSPPVGTYNTDLPRPLKQSAKPFGSGAKLEHTSKWLTPPPGAHTFFKHEVKVCNAFGSAPRIIIPLVMIKCGQYNMSHCFKCKEQPVGDYWHKDSTNQDMCRPCMEDEWKEINTCFRPAMDKYRKSKELKNFHLMRYCGFYHDHNGTKSATSIMSKKHLLYKTRTENYLAAYGF